MFRQIVNRISIVSFSSKINGRVGSYYTVKRGLAVHTSYAKADYRASETIPKETIAYSNVADFPPEKDPKSIVRRSIYGNSIQIPKCSAAEYIWSSVDGWWNKTAVVRMVNPYDLSYQSYHSLKTDYKLCILINMKTFTIRVELKELEQLVNIIYFRSAVSPAAALPTPNYGTIVPH